MEITANNKSIADALAAVYLAGGSETMSLHGMALAAGVPLSDLYGAIGRYWKTIPRGARPTKRCSRCREERVVADFAKNPTKKDGLDYRCKICKRLEDRKRRAA